MEFMPVFSLLGSFLGGGGEKDDSPAPVAEAPEREVAGKAPPEAQTPGDKQKAAVAASRKPKVSGSTLNTRSGVNIVGGT
jgi:hypothetical protein